MCLRNSRYKKRLEKKKVSSVKWGTKLKENQQQVLLKKKKISEKIEGYLIYKTHKHLNQINDGKKWKNYFGY